MSQIPPYLSLFDPHERSEGSIDPLGMMGNYERLAERIYPWMTVRMRQPRFFRRVMEKASALLRERLVCIDAYEGLGRMADDAFRYILFLSSEGALSPYPSGTSPGRLRRRSSPNAFRRRETGWSRTSRARAGSR